MTHIISGTKDKKGSGLLQKTKIKKGEHKKSIKIVSNYEQAEIKKKVFVHRHDNNSKFVVVWWNFTECLHNHPVHSSFAPSHFLRNKNNKKKKKKCIQFRTLRLN